MKLNDSYNLFALVMIINFVASVLENFPPVCTFIGIIGMHAVKTPEERLPRISFPKTRQQALFASNIFFIFFQK